MQNNYSKKLLILGATVLCSEIVRCAKKNGIKTYVTDYIQGSPAKLIADKSFMVSTTDLDALKELVKNEKIDGILTGFIDSLLPHYVKLCNETRLLSYATGDQIEILTDKSKFKETCRKFNIPVVEEYTVKDPLLNDEYLNLKYPVLLKPADNSGGRGITICYTPNEFKNNYERTISFSKSKQVLIERFMKAKEATIFYILQDGNIKLSAMGDRHIQHFQEGVIPLPVAYTFPSEYLIEYQKNIDQKVIAMFKHLGMKNGMVFIQTFIENGECVFYEIGYRLTGSLEYKIIEHACGYNPMNIMIEQAVEGKSNTDITKLVNPNFDKYYCNITFPVMPGKIGKLTNADEILRIPNVIDIVYSYNEGDEIPPKALGTLAQVVARVFAYAESKVKLAEIIKEIQGQFKVLSNTGENMLLPVFNPDSLIV